MINVNVKREKSAWRMEVKGHAGYADYGHDIVCAAISTACILTANLTEKIDLGYNLLDIVADEGYFLFVINPKSKLATAIFDNMEYCVDDIQKQYPKYIKYTN